MYNYKKDEDEKRIMCAYSMRGKVKKMIKEESSKLKNISASAWVEDAVVTKLKNECGYRDI